MVSSPSRFLACFMHNLYNSSNRRINGGHQHLHMDKSHSVYVQSFAKCKYICHTSLEAQGRNGASLVEFAEECVEHTIAILS